MIKESLFAAEEREAKLDKLGDVLQRMEQHVDFKALAAPRPDPSRGGRPPFPTELMVMVLQQLYGLSDERMEYQLHDRLSFQRFAGLRRRSQIPDRTTLWTFRERLSAAGVAGGHLRGRQPGTRQSGLLARGGQIVDATLVPAPIQHNTSKERGLVKEGVMPIGWKPPKHRQKDVDATWTKKHGKSHFGYKLSVSAASAWPAPPRNSTGRRRCTTCTVCAA